MSSPELSCRQLVELVTDYLEGALTPAERARFDAHVAECEGCEIHLEQLRRTVALVGALAEQHIEPAVRDRLLQAFRGFRRST